MPSRKSRSSGKSSKSSVPTIPPSTCTICFTATSEKLLSCDRCQMNVHATCYEMDVKGIFRCVPCSKGAEMKPPPPCAICDESLPAVYLPTTEAGHFAHLFCCEWVPATSVGTDHRTIEDIDQIDPDYRRLTCIVCKKKGGTTLQCAYGRCVRAFHPLCGQLGGMKLVDETPQGPLKTIKCYCDKHIDKASEGPKPKQKKSTSKKHDTVTSTPATTSSSLAPSSTPASNLSRTPSDISTSIDNTPIDHDIFELTHSLSQESHKYNHVEDEMTLLLEEDDRKEGETLEERAVRIAAAAKKEKDKEKQKEKEKRAAEAEEKERKHALKRQSEKEEEEEAERKRLKKEQKRAKKEAEEKERQEAEKAEKQKQKEKEKEKEAARQKQLDKEKKEKEAREKEEARQKQLEKEKKEKEKKEKEAREKEDAARAAAKTKPVVSAPPAKKVIDLEADASDEEDMWEDDSHPTMTKPPAIGTTSATTTSATTSQPTTTSTSAATSTSASTSTTKPSAHPIVDLDSDDSDDEEFNRAIASARKVPPKKPALVSKPAPASKKKVEEEQEEEQQQQQEEEVEEVPASKPKPIKKGKAIKRKRTEIEEEEEEEVEEAPKKKGRPTKHVTTSEEVQEVQDVDMESKHDQSSQDTKTPDEQPSMDETDWEALDYGRGEVEDPNDEYPQWNGQTDVCAVCFTPWPYDDDEIVQCDDCNVMVHQSCYGIWPLPPEDEPWYCSPCQWKRDNPDRISDDEEMMLCAICGHGNVGEMPAAFKPCITKRRKHIEHGWAHLFCGMWTPETEVLGHDEGKMEPIAGLEKIHPDRRKMMCNICKRVKGAVIQCEQLKCLWSYHPLCGKLAKLYFKDLSVLHDTEANVRVTYCKTHDPRNPRLTKEEAAKKKAEEEDHRTLLVMAANSDVSHRQYTLPKRLTEAKIKVQMGTQSHTRKRKSDSNIPTLNVLRRQARNAVKSVPGQKAPRISKAAGDMFSDINKTEILRAIHGNSNAFSDDKTDVDAINATRAAREELQRQRAKQSHIIPVKKRLYRREEEEKEEEEKQEKKRQEKQIETIELEESDSEAENEERERQAKAAASTSTSTSTNTSTITDPTTAPTQSSAPTPAATSSSSFIPTPGLHIDALDPKVFNEKDIRNRRMVRLAFQHVVEQRRGEEIEQTIYNKFGLGPDFLSKARHLAENLNLAGNAQLLARVRAGEIPVLDLVSMSFQELSKYNTELTQQRAADHDEMMKATVIPSEQETADKLKQVALLQKTMITR